MTVEKLLEVFRKHAPREFFNFYTSTTKEKQEYIYKLFQENHKLRAELKQEKEDSKLLAKLLLNRKE